MSSRYIKQKEPEPLRCYFCHVILPDESNKKGHPYFCDKDHAYMWAMQEAAHIGRKYHANAASA